MLMRILQKCWWLILAWLLAMFGTEFWQFNVMELFASIAIVIGVGLTIIGWLGKQKRKAIRLNLDKVIADGECIQARLTSATDAIYNRDEKRLRDWVESVQKILKGTEFYRIWESNAGLPKIEPEGLTDLAQLNDVNKKYMANRLSSLKDIRDKLRY